MVIHESRHRGYMPHCVSGACKSGPKYNLTWLPSRVKATVVTVVADCERRHFQQEIVNIYIFLFIYILDIFLIRRSRTECDSYKQWVDLAATPMAIWIRQSSTNQFHGSAYILLQHLWPASSEWLQMPSMESATANSASHRNILP